MRGRTTRRAFLGQSLLAPGALAGFRALSCRATEPTSEQSPTAEAKPTLDEILDRYWDQIHPAMRYRRAPLDPTLNGWEEWKKPQPSVAGDEIYDAAVDFANRGEFPTGALGKETRLWLYKNAAVLDALDRGLARKRVQLQVDLGLSDQMQLIQLRKAVRAKRLDALRQIVDGDREEGLEQMIDVLRVGERMCAGEGYLVHWLIGSVLRADGLTYLCQLALAAATSVVELRQMLSAVAGPFDLRRSLAVSLQVEYCYFELSWLAEYGGSKNLAELIDRLLENEDAGFLGPDEAQLALQRRRLNELLAEHPCPFDLNETIRLTSQARADFLADLDTTWARRRRDVGEEITARVAAWPEVLTFGNSFSDAEEQQRKLKELSDEAVAAARVRLRDVKNPVGCLLAKANMIWGSRQAYTVALTRDAATRAALALQIHRREHDDLPERLEQVRSATTLELPDDPFSGEPFRYSQKHGLLWSVGPTGDNDPLAARAEDGMRHLDLVWPLTVEAADRLRRIKVGAREEVQDETLVEE